MGCDSSKQNKAGGKKEYIWLCGYPCSGKTFMGDYLQTRGYHHIDGDFGNQSKDPKVQQAWLDILEAFSFSIEKQEVPERKWKDYYEMLVCKFKEAQQQHDRIVLSFAPMGCFNERKWLQEQIPGLKVAMMTVDRTILLDRFLARNAKYMEVMGMSLEQMWGLDHPLQNKLRAKFGDTFSHDIYAKAMEYQYLTLPFECFTDEMKSQQCYTVANNDFKSIEQFRALNKLACLQDKEPIDQEAIAKVNYDRMAKVNLEVKVEQK